VSQITRPRTTTPRCHLTHTGTGTLANHEVVFDAEEIEELADLA